MEKVPNTLFSMPLCLAPDDVGKKIPRRLSLAFKIRSAVLGDDSRSFLAAISVEQPKMAQVRALVSALAKVDGRHVVVCSPCLDRNMMRVLASEGVAYIRDEDNVFLPFLGMMAAPVPNGRAPKPLSPHTQRIVLNLIDGRWDGMTAGELAAAAGVSRSTITNCLAEIESVLPAALAVEWKQKSLRNPGLSKAELLDVFEPYFISPVKQRIGLKGRDALLSLRDRGALLSGESALSFYSDLAFGSSALRVALPRKMLSEVIGVAGESWAEAEWFEEPDVIVEAWLYQFDGLNEASRASVGLNSLDALNLYVEVRGMEEDDARFVDAVEQLREAVCR